MGSLLNLQTKQLKFKESDIYLKWIKTNLLLY
jgi:hypothetical protein